MPHKAPLMYSPTPEQPDGKNNSSVDSESNVTFDKQKAYSNANYTKSNSKITESMHRSRSSNPKKKNLLKLIVKIILALVVLDLGIMFISSACSGGDDSNTTEEVNDSSETSSSQSSSSKNKKKYIVSILKLTLGSSSASATVNGKAAQPGELYVPQIFKDSTEATYFVVNNINSNIAAVATEARAKELTTSKSDLHKTYLKQKGQGNMSYDYDKDTDTMKLKVHGVTYNSYGTDTVGVKNLHFNETGKAKLQKVFDNLNLKIDKDNIQKVVFTNQDFKDAGNKSYRVVYTFNFKLSLIYPN